MVRNRLRRRLRAIAGSQQILPEADIVIRPSQACVNLSFPILQAAFVDLVGRISAADSARAPSMGSKP